MDSRHSGPMPAQIPRLLFIDAYDSFSNNIISLLRLQLCADVTTIKIDDPRFNQDEDNDTLYSFLHTFNAVVVGPGPGDPRRPEDIGVIAKLWTLPDDHLLPILGVCLGFQSLALAFGGSVARLAEPRHGLVKLVTHSTQSLFGGVCEVRATQYHSWHAQLGHDASAQDTSGLWRPTDRAPRLVPLAWDFSDQQNGPVLMAIRHTEKPFWGVQYHPESVCTNEEGARVIQNWWREAQIWTSFRRKGRSFPDSSKLEASMEGLDSGYGTDIESKSPSPNPERATDFRPEALSNPIISTPMLESGTKHGKPVRSETGRHSILCFVEPDRRVFRYWTDRQILEVLVGDVVKETYTADVFDSFDHIKSWVSDHKAVGGPRNIPFWGGLVGLVSYEAGLETISVPPVDADPLGPDLCFVSVRRSFVIDHVDKKLYIQDLSETGDCWVNNMQHLLSKSTAETVLQDVSQRLDAQSTWKSTIHRPAQAGYCKKVELCQSHIRAGDSYELCLTDRSDVHFENSDTHSIPHPSAIYHKLRQTNPAPFGALLCFDQVAVVSSSPERFLSWTRDGLCEFRPIKGTVQKRPGVTRESAEAILKTDKEQAENLMIVDLIRHDLNGVVGLTGGSALSPKLMQVEEYETVYQLVSVIRGQLNTEPPPNSPSEPAKIVPRANRTKHRRTLSEHGIDVLRASLPPGSMTGAPKKRSCELLKTIEDRRRGAYSGVLGYLDVGGGGDFSVVIRSVIKDSRGFCIAAGGAVTALSDPLGEFEEMMAKSTAVQI
ncbi:hypothetical protein ANO11243_017160 [Dothideomycetidae sp. 11243]|nr:hypothetical protein ANO11243_017160 [fungal sp. No.11243]